MIEVILNIMFFVVFTIIFMMALFIANVKIYDAINNNTNEYDEILEEWNKRRGKRNGKSV